MSKPNETIGQLDLWLGGPDVILNYRARLACFKIKNQEGAPMKLTAVFIFISIFTIQTQAKTLQEGWFQLLSGQQHVGYIVQRYSFDDSKKQFKYVAYTKTNALGGNINESVTEVCDTGFAPVSYQYTSQVDKNAKLIDAVFKGDSMTAKITEGDQKNTIQEKIKKGTFLSNFLIYMILNNKAGLKTGNSFEYNAIAEEDAKVSKGFADVKEIETVNGHETFKILNNFKDIKSINHVSPIGEILDIKQPANGLQLIAAKKEDATKGFPSSDKLVKTLFGDIPKDSPLATPKAETKMPTKKSKPKADDAINANAAHVEVPPGKAMPPKIAPHEESQEQGQ